jgi:hypothetical protein
VVRLRRDDGAGGDGLAVLARLRGVGRRGRNECEADDANDDLDEMWRHLATYESRSFPVGAKTGWRNGARRIS